METARDTNIARRTIMATVKDIGERMEAGFARMETITGILPLRMRADMGIMEDMAADLTIDNLIGYMEKLCGRNRM